MIYLITTIILIATSIVISIFLYNLSKFIDVKLDDAMGDIAWGEALIYEIDYKIVRWFKGAEIDRGKQTLAKWKDLCKLAKKVNKYLLIVAKIFPVFVALVCLLFYLVWLLISIL